MKTSDQKPNAEIANLLGKEMDLAGFIIVNEMNSDELTDFLVTPISGGCIHVPPPPPNYVVKVVMEKEAHAKYVPGPILMKGRLQLPKDQKDRKYYTLEFIARQMGPFRSAHE